MGVQSCVLRYPREDAAYPLNTCTHSTSPTRYKAHGPMRDAAHNRRGPIRVLAIVFLTCFDALGSCIRTRIKDVL
jgi:hypothetical protein